MGMFDEVICEYSIEGGLPTWVKNHPFQTKDLECILTRYTIFADGTFSVDDWTGTLNFYTSNIVGSGPGIYTENGEDAESIDCFVKIVDGKVAGDIQVERETRKAWPVSKMGLFKSPTKDEIRLRQERNAESLVGKRLYVLWGGQEVGYWVTVIAENDRQLVCRHESDHKYYKAGHFELIDRIQRDNTFFDGEEEGLTRRKSKNDEWNREKAEFEAFSNKAN